MSEEKRITEWDSGETLLRDTTPSGEYGITPSALVGTVLDGRYELLSLVGSGGMGHVYRARHQVLGTVVAIKVLRSEAGPDGEAAERFRREARGASAIGHPHIVDVRDFGVTPEGVTYIVMELVNGVQLTEAGADGPLAWQRVRRIARQVCSALGAAHAVGIIHRDLKAENVLLCVVDGDSDFVKIVDFGIAKFERAKRITAKGRIIGTPQYMAPEQCAGRPVDRRADIYAYGVLLYELLTGELPFDDADLVSLLKKHLYETPLAPSERRPDGDFPIELDDLVMTCLAKDPEERFASMREVAEALIRIDGDEDEDPRTWSGAWQSVPASSLETLPTPAPPQPVAPAAKSWRVPLLVIGSLALVLGAVGVMSWSSAGVESPTPMTSDTVVPVEVRPNEPETAGPPPEPSAIATPPGPTPVAGATDTITVLSAPVGAAVYEGDRLVGRTPVTVTRPVGAERVNLELREAGFQSSRVSLSAATHERVEVALRRRARVRASRHEPRPSPVSEPVQRSASPPPTTRRHDPGFRDPWAN